MTEVDTHFYDSQLQNICSFNMPDDDAVRNIADSRISSLENNADFEGGLFRQDRAYNGPFDHAAESELCSVKNQFQEDEFRLEKFSASADFLESERTKCSSPSSQNNNIEKQGPVVCESVDVPVSYQVHGLKQHEMPVIGFHVDQRIMPGFRYRVRVLNNSSNIAQQTSSPPRHQFNGQALHLLRIGQGYGRRLTFTGSLNDNPNFFWSDSDPSGYAFSMVAVDAGDQMVLTDLARRPIGRGTVEEVSPCQTELGTEITKDKTIIKRISVIMKVLLRYSCERHGMRSIRANETVIVRGVARVVKHAGKSQAFTKCIEQIELPIQGECMLYML
ncbi:uncharacterized protein [Asterias amurensis]|uniref:uncharacterized protein n=1 Tax=Asterias amurensis TaxID=7602 RepID=UPI003AB48A36